MQVADRQRRERTANVEEVLDVARELDIEDEYVQAAIEELRARRAARPTPAPGEPGNSPGSRPRPGPGRWVVLVAFVVAAVAAWSFLVSDEPEVRPAVAEVAVEEPPPVEGDAQEPAVIEPAVMEPPREPAHTPGELAGAVAGDWILVAYHMRSDDGFFEVALSGDKPYDVRERWRLRDDGTFLHVMGDSLSFSGRYEISARSMGHDQATTVPGGTAFLLTARDVHSNVPGIQRPVEYFSGVIKGDRLVFFYLGTTQSPTKPPSQAHAFRRSWRGGWTW